MKNIFLTACILFQIKSFAQWGAEAGLNISDYSKSNGTYRIGYRVGATAQVKSYSEQLFLQTSVDYVQNGTIVNMQNVIYHLGVQPTANNNLKMEMIVHSLEIPVMLMYKTAALAKGGFIVGGGPYLVINMAASTKMNGDNRNYKIDNSRLCMLEAGIGVNAGYQFGKRIFLKGYYKKGLLSIFHTGNNTPIFLNSNLGLIAGIFLRG